MIFTNWKEFFDIKEENPFNRHGVVMLEELYQHFKARLLSEVVAKETITYFGDIVGNKQYELGEKDK